MITAYGWGLLGQFATINKAATFVSALSREEFFKPKSNSDGLPHKLNKETFFPTLHAHFNALTVFKGHEKLKQMFLLFFLTD